MKTGTYDIMVRYIWGSNEEDLLHWSSYKATVEFHEDHVLDKLIAIGLFEEADREGIRIEGSNVFLLRHSNDYPVARLIPIKTRARTYKCTACRPHNKASRLECACVCETSPGYCVVAGGRCNWRLQP